MSIFEADEHGVLLVQQYAFGRDRLERLERRHHCLQNARLFWSLSGSVPGSL
jgi:hypothetical protein